MDSLLNLKYDFLHCKIVYSSPEELYQIVTVKIALTIYYAEIYERGNYRCEMENLQRKICSLMIPETFKTSLSQMVELIKIELNHITNLICNISKCLRLNDTAVWLHKIHWTQQGTVDQISTAKAFADSVHLDATTRFKIAVHFCLIDRVNALSFQMPRDYLNIDSDVAYYIKSLDGAFTAREHFKIYNFVPSYFACFGKMFMADNQPGYHYFWHYLDEESKLYILDSYDFKGSLLWLFLLCDYEKRLKILYDVESFCRLLKNLLHFEWLSTFSACLKNVRQFLTIESAVELLDCTVMLLEERISYRKTYLQICVILLKFLSKECSETNVCCSHPSYLVLNAMHHLVDDGEIKMITTFLQEVSNERIL